ncbi:hypothetical protein DM02DRAFT_209880 [Periconia macrospinosa]|uniref:DUF4105 domain-containing protein n=1 Tax=Periconia macrospinosa TaxID=97972 RepID=A0A2V1D8P9_9PLEO|nr:hypothetical protein DM02DRAFT_209880 [Periconia macrospinosa]
MIFNLFFRFIALLVVFHSSLASAVRINPKDLLVGTEPPKDLKVPPRETIAWTTTGRQFPNDLLAAILKQQRGEVPVKGAIYVFTQFQPGAIYENVVNGGKHVLLVTAQWGYNPGEFRADKHELGLYECQDPQTKTENKDKGIAKYKDGNFDFDKAYNAVKYKNRFLALGKSGLKTDYNSLMSKIETHSDKYFAKNKDYDYLLNNCGDYVQEMVDLTQPEYAQLEVVLAPPMMKRMGSRGKRFDVRAIKPKPSKKTSHTEAVSSKNAPAATKASSSSKAPAATKASSSSKAPAATKASSLTKAPSPTNAPSSTNKNSSATSSARPGQSCTLRYPAGAKKSSKKPKEKKKVASRFFRLSFI